MRPEDTARRAAATAAFRAPWWLRNAHLQTLWPSLMRRAPRPTLRRERLELPDGDFLDLDWSGSDQSEALVLLLHGLQGSSRSAYAAGLLSELPRHGWQTVLMHFRGCSGEPNRLRRSYHSGDTADLAQVIAVLRERWPRRKLACVGFSLGGNVLLKWLGERGDTAGIETAVAVSVPFDLARAAQALNQGFSRLYQWHLVGSLMAELQRKFAQPTLGDNPGAGLSARSSFWLFDDRVTARLHGFDDVHDYYARSSSRQYLGAIRVPTLLLQARDDPFLPVDGLPGMDELSDAVTLELSATGGHVGFVSGWRPGASQYWLEGRIVAHLAGYLGEGEGVSPALPPPSC